MTAATACRTCGTEALENARFCHGCGSPVTEPAAHAEYKQVTVLFADVVHSMDIAAAVGASGSARSWPTSPTAARRWCSVTAARSHSSPATGSWRCSARRSRWKTTPFVLAWPPWVFRSRPNGLPSMSASATVSTLRVAGRAELRRGDRRWDGFGPFGYAAVGEQVGVAQRMESVAPPGGVMLSASTARLVEGAASLGEPELVQIKGAEQPVPARRPAGHGRRASR